MRTRLLIGALVLVSAACTTPVSAPAAPQTWACRDDVRSAAVAAYALDRFRDDQRAVMLLPAGEPAAASEAETRRLRGEGARLLAALKANDPEAERLPAPGPLNPASLTDDRVAKQIAAAAACLAETG